MKQNVRVWIVVALLMAPLCSHADATMIVEKNVAVPMRDGVVLRADIFRPDSKEPLPVLLYRTPYDKHFAAREYRTHLKAVERGYVVVLQDVRGRYASDGLFNPYFNEGDDGYDSIEWAAKQSWSNGDVGTYGLSYPAAVQWLAAVRSPPHLKAMVPAMTFSSPRNFFYMNGVFDMSWLPWIYFNIAPDARARLGIEGDITDAEVAAAWDKDGDALLSHLPLQSLPMLRDEAPFYFDWLAHSPYDDWWSWAEIRGRYHRTDAAVLNISGWFDEAYGPEGAVTNFKGLVDARKQKPSRTQLILGPWQHGVFETGEHRLGELYFGPDAGIDYDETLLQFFDRHLKHKETARDAAVRYWVMGANEWRTADEFPPAAAASLTFCLGNKDGGLLQDCELPSNAATTTFTADPQHPVVDPYGSFAAHDFQILAERDDVLVFETAPLEKAVTMAGYATAQLFVSCDCRDFDLWVRLMDVYPDGRAINLMSPGGDVQRMSYRNDTPEKQLLTPGKVYAVAIDGLLTANRFDIGHRIRIQVSASFSPHLSRNLQTGESEITSAESRKAVITLHHDVELPATLKLPVIH